MAVMQVSGKAQNSTARETKTPKPIFTKIGMYDYVMNIIRHIKSYCSRFGVSTPQILDFDVLQSPEVIGFMFLQ